MKTQFWLLPPLAAQVMSWVPAVTEWLGSSSASPEMVSVCVPVRAAVTDQVKVTEEEAVPEEAVTVTCVVPAVVGVPETRPAG